MDSQEPRDVGVAGDAGEAALAARRRFVRGGLVGAPVLLSVVSRPALAVSQTCKSASAFGSVSSRVVTGSTCSGCKPAYWIANQGIWPATCLPTTLFSDKVGASSYYGSKTLLQVLQLASNTGNDGLAKYLVAAHLNSASNRVPTEVMTTGSIRNIWSSYSTLTYYEPTAGVRWGPDSSIQPPGPSGIIAWLLTTMPN